MNLYHRGADIGRRIRRENKRNFTVFSLNTSSANFAEYANIAESAQYRRMFLRVLLQINLWAL